MHNIFDHTSPSDVWGGSDVSVGCPSVVHNVNYCSSFPSLFLSNRFALYFVCFLIVCAFSRCDSSADAQYLPLSDMSQCTTTGDTYRPSIEKQSLKSHPPAATFPDLLDSQADSGKNVVEGNIEDAEKAKKEAEKAKKEAEKAKKEAEKAKEEAKKAQRTVEDLAKKIEQQAEQEKSLQKLEPTIVIGSADINRFVALLQSTKQQQWEMSHLADQVRATFAQHSCKGFLESLALAILCADKKIRGSIGKYKKGYLERAGVCSLTDAELSKHLLTIRTALSDFAEIDRIDIK